MQIRLRNSISHFLSMCRYVFKWLRGYKDNIDFPFDPSLPMPLEAADTLIECTDILNELSIDYFICDGTALGLYRDGCFIKHDNDIDVCVLGEIDLDNLKKKFSDIGYSVGRELYYRGKIQQIIFYSSKHVIFDICVWYDGSDEFAYLYLPELKKGRRQKLSNFYGHDYLSFNDKRYPTHPNLEAWLYDHYGPDWSIPKSSKEDWRLETKDIIK